MCSIILEMLGLLWEKLKFYVKEKYFEGLDKLEALLVKLINSDGIRD